MGQSDHRHEPFTSIGRPHDGQTELTGLSVQIGTLNAECPCGVGYLPAMVLEDGRNVFALETQPCLA
jgi:hypothetical protein